MSRRTSSPKDHSGRRKKTPAARSKSKSARVTLDKRKRDRDIELLDERLTDISSELLHTLTALLPQEFDHAHGHHENVFEFPESITIPDERLRQLSARYGAPSPSSDDRLRSLVVRVVLFTYAGMLFCILAVIIGLAVNAHDVAEASLALSRVLDSAGPFIKIGFGGSTVAVVIAVFKLRPPNGRAKGGDDEGERRRHRRRKDDSARPRAIEETHQQGDHRKQRQA
ncbi:MAG TPA: hypothetical protein VF824_23005 [Thermoanaerobaculia bacterium]|jgi:hypothetical protein